ncbi:PEGA domain-containing protein [Anaeromyxobacter dehalogenans]|uniref:Tetratricopeptide repeat protein n=1 Tax=Anaeromyxobacter dehalogenans (strain 2CP-C) TaxID=290397 RepID=Q2IFQ7_ANADE|nr:PEGA domain-containing protein [Anaeromyxobacter dehalogenans]ABC83414.1 tetratricopeptide repeat protein [Anaeromyxobacter dehalogenans 2CP-C]
MNRPWRLLPLLALLTASAASLPAAARADDVAAASAHFRKGSALYQQRQWRAAIAEFEAAYRLKPHGAIHFNVARCREQLEEWPGALRSYTDYLREVPDARDRAAVRAAIGRIEARLAAAGVQALLVYTDPPGAEVRIDGRPRGTTPFHLTLPPGPYALALALEGYAPVEQAVEVGASVSRVVEVVLRPSAAPAPAPSAAATRPASPGAATAPPAASRGGAAALPPPAPARPDLSARAPAASVPLAPAPQARPSRHRVYTWVAAGAAAAALTAGVLYGQSAQRKRDALVDGTPHDDAASLARDARSKARTANVLYGIAGAAGAAGVTLFFVEGTF